MEFPKVDHIYSFFIVVLQKHAPFIYPSSLVDAPRFGNIQCFCDCQATLIIRAEALLLKPVGLFSKKVLAEHTTPSHLAAAQQPYCPVSLASC